MGCPICKKFQQFRSIFTGKDKGFMGKGFKEYSSGSTFIGKGFKLGDYKKEKLLDIDQENTSRNIHTFVVGASGVGKSKLMEGPMEADVKAGRNVVVIDPKGGGDIYSRLVQAAYAAGRENDLMYCSPIFPEYSIEINPMGNYYMEEELINHAMAAVSSDDEFFYAASLELSTIIIKGLLLHHRYDSPEGHLLNFREVAEYTSYDKLTKLQKNLKTYAEQHGDRDAEYLANLAATQLKTGAEHFGKLTASLRVALTEMTSGNTGKIIGNATTNTFIDKIERGEGVILYVQTGSMIVSRAASTLARVITSMIQSVVGRHDASGLKLARPLCYYGDEFSNVVYRGCEDLFNKGRGAGVWITAATQSVADMIAEIGPERTRKLMDNTSTKIVMRQNDYQSAMHFAAFGGLKKKYSAMLSLSGGITNREVEDDLIRPEEVQRLKPREFFYFGIEGEFKGKSQPMADPEMYIRFPSAIVRRS